MASKKSRISLQTETEHEEQDDEEDQARDVRDEPVGDDLQRSEREREHAARQPPRPRKLCEDEPGVDEHERKESERAERHERIPKRAPDPLGPHHLERLDANRLNPCGKPAREQAIEPAPEPEQCQGRGNEHRRGAHGVDRARSESYG